MKHGIGHCPQKNQGGSPMKPIDELEMMFAETGVTLKTIAKAAAVLGGQVRVQV